MKGFIVSRYFTKMLPKESNILFLFLGSWGFADMTQNVPPTEPTANRIIIKRKMRNPLADNPREKQ